MKWQINRHSDVTCEVIRDTDRAKHTVIHGYECCSTLSRAVCDKSNVMYSSHVVFELSWESSVSNATVRSHCYVTGSTRRLGWAARHNETHRSRTRSRDLTSWLLRRRTGHHWTLVADLADDVSFAARFWTTRKSSTMPTHYSSDNLVVLAVSSVPAVPSQKSLKQVYPSWS